MNGEERQHLLTRRRVIASGIAAAVGATLLDFGTAAVASAKAPGPARLRYRTKGFKRARFAPHVGTQIKLRPAGAPAIRGQLVAVEDLAGASVRHLAGSQDAYALRFRAPQAVQLEQSTIGIRHPRFGVVRLFVTPSTSTPQYQDYVAVINRVTR